MPTIEELEAQLQARIERLHECILVGERLAKAEGYRRGYAAGKKWRQQKWSEPKSQPSRKYPMPVSCYGRRYEVKNEDELGDLLQNLIEGRLALANRYRVADTKYSRWPKATNG